MTPQRWFAVACGVAVLAALVVGALMFRSELASVREKRDRAAAEREAAGIVEPASADERGSGRASPAVP